LERPPKSPAAGEEGKAESDEGEKASKSKEMCLEGESEKKIERLDGGGEKRNV